MRTFENEDQILDSLGPIYSALTQYKLLHEYYMRTRGKHLRTEEEIRARMDYLLKNPKVSQNSEYTTLLWVLNEGNGNINN